LIVNLPKENNALSFLLLRTRLYISLLLLFVSFISGAQTAFTLKFRPTFQGAQLSLDSSYPLANNHSIQFETLKLYISNIKLFHHQRLQLHDAEKAYLLNYANPSSFEIRLKLNTKIEVDEIEFQVGIDSMTNQSGALGGSLDPTLGMYWTWQNGYINLKLEGKSTLSSSPKNNFEFHIGGYMHPFETIQTIRLKGDFSKHKTIQLDLDSLFNQLDLSKVHHIMSPGNEAVAFSNLIKSMFKLMP
jgi:hypothetical protein